MKDYKYNELEFIKTLNDEELKKFKEEFELSINSYEDDFINITSSITSMLKTNSFLSVLIQSLILMFKKVIHNVENFLSLHDDLDIEFRRFKTVNEYIIKIGRENNVENLLNNLYLVIKNDIDRILFCIYLIKVPVGSKVCLNNISLKHILAIGNKDIEVSYHKISNELKDNIELFTTNNKISKCGSLNNDYCTCSFVNNYPKVEKYFKIVNKNVNRLTSLYVESTYFPSTYLVKKRISDYFNEKEDYFFYLPLFLSAKSKIFESKNHGYYRIYYEFSKYYDEIIKIIIEQNTNQNVVVIIPNIMRYSDYSMWRSKIRMLSKESIKTGVMVDDLDLCFDLLEAGDVEYIIINLDYLFKNEYGIKEINIKEFKESFEEEFRVIKNMLKEKKVECILYSLELKDTEVMEKLMKMGFKNYHYSPKNSKSIKQTLDNYMSRRGIYKKKPLK